MTPNFQVKNAVLVMALAAVYPLHSQGAAGVAQFASGDVAVRRGGAMIALAKGRDLESGDAITTGSSGRAQIRFTDGGIVSLQPNSQFDITKYVDANDPAQDSFLVNFARGSMRAITGLIGKRNTQNYRVQTATATVGIRGSGFSASYNSDGTLSITGELDEIIVCTNGGCVSLSAGETALVVNNNEAPVRTLVRANLPTPAPRQDVTVTGNTVKANGLSAIITLPAATPKAPAKPVIETVGAPWVAYFSGAHSSGYGNLFHANETYPATLELESFSGTTKLNQYVATDNTSGYGLGNLSLTKPSMASFGSAGKTSDEDFIGWGHWTSATYNAYQQPANAAAQNVHYITGKPSSSTQMSALQGMTGTYDLIGGTTTFTASTCCSGQAGPVQVGSVTAGALSVAFFPTTTTITGSLTTKFGANSVNVDLASSGTGSRFSCGAGTILNGFFTGATANRAGLVFSTTNTGPLGAGVINGAAGFQQKTLTTPAPVL